MRSILLDGESIEFDALVASAAEAGTLGLAEEAGAWRAYFDDGVDRAVLERLAELAGSAVNETQPASTITWDREGWDGCLIGHKFFVAPPWVTEAPPAGRTRLTVEPSAAFGTGRHETTQLCLRALEEYQPPDATVVDVGCGSGILSAAAKLLGARQVISCDTDGESVGAARRLATNPIYQGSVDAIRDGTGDLVIANISAAVLDRLASDLKRVVKPEGLLIVSGFLAEKTPACFRPMASFEQDEWLCWVCSPGGIEARAEHVPAEGLTHEREWWL